MSKILDSIRNEGILGFSKKLLNYVCSNFAYSLEAYFIFKKTLIAELENDDLFHSVILLSKPCEEEIEKLIKFTKIYFY